MEEGWSDTAFPDSSQEAVERGETMGSVAFSGWGFTLGADKWESGGRHRGAGGEAAPSLGAAGLQSRRSHGKLHPLVPSLVRFLSLDVVVMLLLAKNCLCGRYANVL